MKTILHTILLLSIVFSHRAAPQPATIKTYLPTLSFSRPFQKVAWSAVCGRGGGCPATIVVKNVSDYAIANLVLTMVYYDDAGRVILKYNMDGLFEVIPPGQLNYYNYGYDSGFMAKQEWFYSGWTTENIAPTIPLSITLSRGYIQIHNQTDAPLHGVRYVYWRSELDYARHFFITPDTLMPGQFYTTTTPYCYDCSPWGPYKELMTAQGTP